VDARLPDRRAAARGAFDLVAAQYPALLLTPTRDAERSLLAAVAPGGHLLVVHHVSTDAHIEEAKAHGFDPAVAGARPGAEMAGAALVERDLPAFVE
jgi:hypothetical protein